MRDEAWHSWQGLYECGAACSDACVTYDPALPAPLRAFACLIAPMEGINWLDLFTATDRFLAAIVERNVMLVYVVLFSISFRNRLVFMAFLPGDSLLFVAGAVAVLPALESRASTSICSWSSLRRRGAGQHAQLLHRCVAWQKVYDGTIGWIDQHALMKTHAFSSATAARR